jgi:hypothetical protein
MDSPLLTGLLFERLGERNDFFLRQNKTKQKREMSEKAQKEDFSRRADFSPEKNFPDLADTVGVCS